MHYMVCNTVSALHFPQAAFLNQIKIKKGFQFIMNKQCLAIMVLQVPQYAVCHVALHKNIANRGTADTWTHSGEAAVRNQKAYSETQ